MQRANNKRAACQFMLERRVIAHPGFRSDYGPVSVDLLAEFLGTVESGASLRQHLAAAYVGDVILLEGAEP